MAIRPIDSSPQHLEPAASPAPHTHKSAVWLKFEALGQSSPSTLCVSCPAGIWVRTGKTAMCYCRVLSLEVWTTERPIQIDDCDGYILALVQQQQG